MSDSGTSPNALPLNPAAAAKFQELDALIQELVDATYDVDSVHVNFTLITGERHLGPLTKVYVRRRLESDDVG